jgi:hypothetical protein
MFAKLINNTITEVSETDYSIKSGEFWVPIQKHFVETNELEFLVGLKYSDPDTGEVGFPEIFTQIALD